MMAFTSTRFRSLEEALPTLSVVGCRTQMSLVRNLASEVFPPQMKARDAQRLGRELAAFFCSHYKAQDLTADPNFGKIVGPQFGLSMEADRGPAYRLVCVEDFKGCEIWIELMSANHFTFSMSGIFWDFEAKMAVLQSFVDEVGKKLAFAYDAKLGYLTTQMTLIGTGLRIRTWMHLNALYRYNYLEALSHAMEAFGVFVEIDEEDTLPDGHLFILFNRSAIHATTVEIVAAFEQALALAAYHEMTCRQRLYRERPFELYDSLEAARAQLSSRVLLSEHNAFQALSNLQVAVSLKIFKAEPIVKDFQENPWFWICHDTLFFLAAKPETFHAMWRGLPPSIREHRELSVSACRAIWFRKYATMTYTKNFLKKVQSV